LNSTSTLERYKYLFFGIGISYFSVFSPCFSAI